MPRSWLRTRILIAVSAASCASQPDVPRVRFVNSPPVTVVDDRRDVPKRPAVSSPYLDLDYYDRAFAGPLTHALSLAEHGRALGVNAHDEVPDSTWFTNRIGVRALTPDEIRRGPGEGEGPELHTPWTIHSTKPGGTEVGFVVTDARGVKYGVGFDTPSWPELETGTDVVVNRLVYAFGYNVPDDRIAYVRPEELVLAPDAAIKDARGRRLRRLDRAELDRMLATVAREPDGRFRVLASRWLPGQSLGGWSPSGVRRDDPNDRIPHEDRRDLRGQYALFAWLEHVDLVKGNFPDMWITSPSGRRYVVHYLLDFGKSLGGIAATDDFIRAGHQHLFEWTLLGSPIFSLGLAPRPWGHHWAPPLRGVSPTFIADGFEPGAWTPAIQYAPFDAASKLDKFWGAKIVARFTPEQIRAAVEAGQFSDPRTVDYLTSTLIARQRMTEAYWYQRVNPLDHFRANGGLCFEDLAISAGLATPAQTRYELASYDRNGRTLGRSAVAAAPTGPTCASGLNVAQAADGYTIVKITTARELYAGSTYVHLAKDPASGALRVIGVWRI